MIVVDLSHFRQRIHHDHDWARSDSRSATIGPPRGDPARPAGLPPAVTRRDDQMMPVTPLSAGLASRLRQADFTYPETGQTAGPLPPGYHHLRRSAVVGSGAEFFARAARDVLSWQVQLRSGLRVAAPAATVSPGAVAVVGIGVGPLRVSAPCRVVYVVAEPRRQGFAYGTLPGHPETGEEAFLLEQDTGGRVTFTVIAFSRPGGVRARLAGPAGRAVQSLVTARYLRSLPG
jgi:uncharacterized protein (UPF0548 family)